MVERVATVIVERRLLVREALESLMGKHSYRVMCGVASTADIDSSSIVADGPKLVILGAQSADDAVAEAVGIRKLWPDCKIILLFEHASPTDFEKLLTSHIDGCVPLFVSPDTLIGTLDLIMVRDVRVMVVGDMKHPSISLTQKEDSHQGEIGTDRFHTAGADHEAVSMAMIAMPHPQPPVNCGTTSDLSLRNGHANHVPPPRNLPKLSDRESRILDGLVKGQANKVIARTCAITEATVKVHMKSILRKIRVANRTQAAIWALEHGYSGDETRAPAAKAAATTHDAASIY
jgi:two-component system, NarL family, nitrate/nitrite response regulator NarL